MDQGAEIFDVVDDHDRVVGQASRREVHARRLKHRAVHVLVFNPRGELYLQKRAATKDSFPGCYDSSASGHLSCGEDYDACAVRELHEELGLVIRPAQLERLFQIPAGVETGWEFVWVYRLRTDAPCRPNPDEIESGQFLPLPAIRADIARQPDRYARSFIKVFDAVARFG